MRWLVLLTMSVLVACTPETKYAVSEVTVDSTDTAINTDTVADISTKDTLNPTLLSLLEQPIDLAGYKEKWGGSNSGHSSESDLYQPDTTGFQYAYFLFWKLRNELPEHPTEGELFEKFRIIVYKYGEEVGQFSDTNEELLAIECQLDNTTLGNFNFYNMSPSEVIAQIGAPLIDQGELYMYYFEEKTISIHFHDEKVDWFKYARLSNPLELGSEIPEFLVKF